MTAKVRVVDPAEYREWVERQKRLIAEGQELAQEQRRGNRGGNRTVNRGS